MNRWFSGYSFHHLLLWLFIYLVAGPFLQGLPHAKIILSIVISSVLFFAVYTINQQSPLFKSSIFLMGATLLLIWCDVLHLVKLPPSLNTAVMLIYIGLLIYSFTRYVFRAKVVTGSLICAALCLYLLIGMFWGLLYEVVESLAPGSFAGDLLKGSASAMEMRQHFQYFSFVTLTTLGYGDILPKSAGASALCHTEAIMGQFFMTVLVARLVGLQVSQQACDLLNRQEEKN